MEENIEPGTIRVINGQTRIYQEGYWIKTYPVPEDTLLAKKRLIQALTRRLFNHTEHGLNVPGNRLEEAKASYEQETDPSKKRVKGAMYAGAMFNRATDIFTKLVELQAMGVHISSSNDLMRECGRCLQDALGLSRLVLHRSGEEGIDELWGEPFRAFSIPIDAFYESRYLKIGQAMRDIDRIADALVTYIGCTPMFAGIEGIVREFAEVARLKTETLRTDRDIFDVWAAMVTTGERLAAFKPNFSDPDSEAEKRKASFGTQLICNGRDLIFYVTRARVAMPKSTQEFIERCQVYAEKGIVDVMPVHLPA
jgi:hypothetical protein